jgi:hypothetical protein
MMLSATLARIEFEGYPKSMATRCSCCSLIAILRTSTPRSVAVQVDSLLKIDLPAWCLITPRFCEASCASVSGTVLSPLLLLERSDARWASASDLSFSPLILLEAYFQEGSLFASVSDFC